MKTRYFYFILGLFLSSSSIYPMVKEPGVIRVSSSITDPILEEKFKDIAEQVLQIRALFNLEGENISIEPDTEEILGCHAGINVAPEGEENILYIDNSFHDLPNQAKRFTLAHEMAHVKQHREGYYNILHRFANSFTDSYKGLATLATLFSLLYVCENLELISPYVMAEGISVYFGAYFALLKALRNSEYDADKKAILALKNKICGLEYFNHESNKTTGLNGLIGSIRKFANYYSSFLFAHPTDTRRIAQIEKLDLQDYAVFPETGFPESDLPESGSLESVFPKSVFLESDFPESVSLESDLEIIPETGTNSDLENIPEIETNLDFENIPEIETNSDLEIIPETMTNNSNNLNNQSSQEINNNLNNFNNMALEDLELCEVITD